MAFDRRPAPIGTTDTSASLRPAVNVLAYSAATNSALIAAGSVLAGTIIGGLITLVVTWLQTRHATAERRAAAADARRERAAAILGPVKTFLTDIDPARIGINANPETTPKELEALAARRNILRDELSILSAASEDERVMTRTADLEIAIFVARMPADVNVRVECQF